MSDQATTQPGSSTGEGANPADVKGKGKAVAQDVSMEGEDEGESSEESGEDVRAISLRPSQLHYANFPLPGRRRARYACTRLSPSQHAYSLLSAHTLVNN